MHGVRAGDKVQLASPVHAVQRFARDPAFEVLADGEPERWLSAVEIQRQYLTLVEARLGDRDMPEWGEAVCRLWRRVLDGVEAQDDRLDGVMDWAIKRRLFQRVLERRGVSWAALEVWEAALMQLRNAWNEAGGRAAFDPLKAIDWTVLAATRSRLARHLEHSGLTWSHLPNLFVARKQVFELDAKFGGLDAMGIFNALDTAGVLQHRVEGLDIGDAETRPPQDTRARVRGDVVRRLSAEGVSYGAEWVSVHDATRGRVLDLSNPFESEERWREKTVLDYPSSRSA
jgi:hypothetical protein